MREREIKNGLRAAPEKKPEKIARPFGEVFAEYMAWGRAQGGWRGLPWNGDHACHKEHDIIFWRKSLGLEDIADAIGILPRVEAECRKMLSKGKSGKTVSNHVQNLRAMLLWCKKRKYLNENPLEELGKFDIEPTFMRRAMTLDEYDLLLDGCAAHRILLYEVAACTGFRENELRMLEPKHLDRNNCAIRLERKLDKGRKERLQPIPAALMERLDAFVASGEAKKLYARVYRNQGRRATRKKPPQTPLLYVPANSATMLKKDLKAAGVPFETAEGRLDFHALRTAYINFLLDVGANVKTTQALARHATPEMTMNVYGRARHDKQREAVELLGDMLRVDRGGQTLSNHGKQNYRISTELPVSAETGNNGTPGTAEGSSNMDWCRKQDVAGTFHGLRGVPNRGVA
jgi:integrase